MAVDRKYLRPPSGHFFLFGPRGTGKSTWLRSAYPHAVWIDLLSPAHQRRYAARPERLRELVGLRQAKPMSLLTKCSACQTSSRLSIN